MFRKCPVYYPGIRTRDVYIYVCYINGNFKICQGFYQFSSFQFPGFAIVSVLFSLEQYGCRFILLYGEFQVVTGIQAERVSSVPSGISVSVPCLQPQ